MGHYVDYMDFPRTATKGQISEARDRVIRRNGERDGDILLSHDNGFKLHDGNIFDSYDEAVHEIERLDRGWYDDHGVLYRDYSRVKPTKEIDNLKRRISETRIKQKEFVQNHMPNRVKAEFVGCRVCGSKVAKKYLEGIYCPVCHKDIRPQSTIDKDKSYSAKIRELQDRIIELEKKQWQKAEVRWLVKIEFHV